VYLPRSTAAHFCSPNGWHCRRRPERSGKGRATKDHCDTAAAGSESEGVRRLRVEPQRTQRTRRNAEASVTAPVKRLCGRAMLAWTRHSERFSNPGPVEATAFPQPTTVPQAKTAAPPRVQHGPRRIATAVRHHTAPTKAPTRLEAKRCRHPGKFARRCATLHHTLSKGLLGNG